MTKGAGYVTIYSARGRKYELSAQETSLRSTTIVNRERREVLYVKVEENNTIDEIEFKSERWKPYGVESSCKYIIMEQLTAAGKPTGYIKIIKSSRANVRGIFDISVDAVCKTDWKYYKRRSSSQ